MAGSKQTASHAFAEVWNEFNVMGPDGKPPVKWLMAKYGVDGYHHDNGNAKQSDQERRNHNKKWVHAGGGMGRRGRRRVRGLAANGTSCPFYPGKLLSSVRCCIGASLMASPSMK